jgi:hypothetical protein
MNITTFAVFMVFGIQKQAAIYVAMDPLAGMVRLYAHREKNEHAA